MSESIDDRVIYVLKNTFRSRWKALEEITGIDRARWRNVAERKTKLRTEELEAIAKAKPRWAYWLTTGDVILTAEQSSPEWDGDEELKE